MYNPTHLVLHIYKSQAESQFDEALRNQEMQKRKLLQKEREERLRSVMLLGKI